MDCDGFTFSRNRGFWTSGDDALDPKQILQDYTAPRLTVGLEKNIANLGDTARLLAGLRVCIFEGNPVHGVSGGISLDLVCRAVSKFDRPFAPGWPGQDFSAAVPNASQEGPRPTFRPVASKFPRARIPASSE